MKVAIRCFAVALFCASCSPPEPAPPEEAAPAAQPPAAQSPGMPASSAPVQLPATSSLDAADMAFAYADISGTRLLALSDLDAMQSGRLVEAVCAGGQVMPVRYLGPQKASAASNGRQSRGNFANEGGPLFEIVGTRAAAGGTCMLVPAGYTAAFAVQPPVSSGLRPAAPTPALEKQSVDDVARAKNRGVREARLLHAGEGRAVAAVEFLPDGDRLLGSLVLLEPGQLSFLDMPASIEKGRADGGCWRVDDDCRFLVDGMNVLAVLGRAEPLVLVTLDGAEGQVILLLQSRQGKLVEIGRGNRYLAPV